MPETQSVNIFIAYSHRDKAFLYELRTHLFPLKSDYVSIWDDIEIDSGEEWDTSIKNRLNSADIILLLVSSDFLSSSYILETELPIALRRHEAKNCIVIPVILRYCLWEIKLGHLQALPQSRPIEAWKSKDKAYWTIAKELTKTITKIQQDKTKRGLVNPIGDLMILIDGGTFDMGSGINYDEKPVRRVRVSDFYMCKIPVNQKTWKQIMGYNLSYFTGNDDLPVEEVNWNDAQEFIKKLNAYSGQRYRLPSEAEWEYAARGGKQSKGFEYSGSNYLDEVGWYDANSKSASQLFGLKKPNELGLLDMSGNVWEWCEDIWHDNYIGAPGSGVAWTTPGDKNHRVLRGGSWLSNAKYCRVSYRSGWNMGYRNNFVGFRLAHDCPM